MKKIITISGMTTSGKSYFSDLLSKSGNYEEVASFTTRNPRPGEVNGIHYNFITREEALSIIERGEAFDYSEINGNYYGSCARDFDKIHEKGIIPILVCDPVGPQNLINYEDSMNFKVLPLFIDVDKETLSNRVLDRMLSEQSHIQELFSIDSQESYDYEMKSIEEYRKRMNNMSSFNDEEISDIFRSVKELFSLRISDDTDKYNKEFNALRERLSSGLANEDSIEGKWRSQIDYFKIIKSEDIESNPDKVIKDLNESISSFNKRKNKTRNASLNI